MTVLTHIGKVPIETFLNDYWQQQPLFCRAAFAGYRDSLDAEKLFALACSEEAESRLICEQPVDKPLESDWSLEHGPFDHERFDQLPNSHCTLLVQAVNHWHPELAALLDRFRFVPNWRIDDIMVSYARDKGGVGPHFDQYDVFLLQASGKRRWRIGQKCDHRSQTRSDLEMNILSEFDCHEEYFCEPGDLLYIPPGVAHWGEAEGESLTYSIGFRAPSHSDLILEAAQTLAASLSADQRISDRSKHPCTDPALITDSDIDYVQSLLINYFSNREQIAQSFGQLATQGYRSIEGQEDIPEWSPSRAWTLRPEARAVYYPIGENALLFVDGERFDTSQNLARALCHYQEVHPDHHTPEERAIIRELHELEKLH